MAFLILPIYGTARLQILGNITNKRDSKLLVSVKHFFRPFSIKSNIFKNEFVGFILMFVSNLCIRVTIIRLASSSRTQIS